MKAYQKIIDLHLKLEDVNYEKIKNAKMEIAPATERILSKSLPEYPIEYDVSNESTPGLKGLLEQRHSVRNYGERKITIKELGNILHYSCGIKSYRSNAYNRDLYPVLYSASAGGLMPINTYVVVSRVEGIDAGLYYFSPGKDSLIQMFCGRPEVELGDLYVSEFPQYAPVNLILTGDIRRFFWKYDYRGYRLMNVDCGILAENICLLAQEQGIGSCMLAAFYGQAVSRVLQLSAEELPLLCLSLGDQDI